MQRLDIISAFIHHIFHGKTPFVALDYDGTLLPINDQPSPVIITPEIHDLLESLSRLVPVAVLSGRSLANIRATVNLPGIIYSGNHGFEIEGPGFIFSPPVSPDILARVRSAADKVHRAFAGIQGTFVEDKGITLSLHFRWARDQDIPAIEAQFDRVVRPLSDKGRLCIIQGKKIFEVRPPVEWDKGKALQWILTHAPLAHPYGPLYPLYAGDDTTDEDAFAALKDSGLTLHVGARSSSAAQYYVEDIPAMIRFLSMLRDYCLTNR